MDSETDDVPVIVLQERDKAFFLQDEHGKRDFFPKSQIFFKHRNIHTGKAVATIPLWLLKEKGWNQ